jgi:integrase
MWCEGTVEGKYLRRSLKTRSWERATELSREIEDGAKPVEAMNLALAIERYLADAKARNLADVTVAKLTLLLNRLSAYCEQKGIELQAITVDHLRDFRERWTDAPITRYKKTERLKGFFHFVQASGWIQLNPARLLRNPIVAPEPTMPFEEKEWERIQKALDLYSDNYGRLGQENAQRLRAFVLLLRYSGLRIRDAVTLRKDSLKDGKLLLRTAKTKVQVWLPVPPEVVSALENCPGPSQEFFFWTGESNPKSSVGNWQRSLRKLFKLARITAGHAHRFRDTFAISLLQSGVPMEEVSILLGHKSISITEKHYAPWVESRQQRLEELVSRTWKKQPKLLRIK